MWATSEQKAHENNTIRYRAMTTHLIRCQWNTGDFSGWLVPTARPIPGSEQIKFRVSDYNASKFTQQEKLAVQERQLDELSIPQN